MTAKLKILIGAAGLIIILMLFYFDPKPISDRQRSGFLLVLLLWVSVIVHTLWVRYHKKS